MLNWQWIKWIDVQLVLMYPIEDWMGELNQQLKTGKGIDQKMCLCVKEASCAIWLFLVWIDVELLTLFLPRIVSTIWLTMTTNVTIDADLCKKSKKCELSHYMVHWINCSCLQVAKSYQSPCISSEMSQHLPATEYRNISINQDPWLSIKGSVVLPIIKLPDLISQSFHVIKMFFGCSFTPNNHEYQSDWNEEVIQESSRMLLWIGIFSESNQINGRFLATLSKSSGTTEELTFHQTTTGLRNESC